jgi:hypothetical protein
MNSYLVKYSTAGLNFVMGHYPNSTTQFDYLDPVTTMVKIGLVGHKIIGTKIGIHHHMVVVQEPGLLQSIQRYISSDDRNQLYQLRFPLLYFHGLALGYIGSCAGPPRELFAYFEAKALEGLKRMKTTYENTTGSMTTNCLDNYIELLNPQMSKEDFQKQTHEVLTSMILGIYQEYMKKWNESDFQILEQLSRAIDIKTDRKAQEGLCATIDAYLDAKGIEISTVRPI